MKSPMFISFIFLTISYCDAAQRLSSYNVDPSETSVSGLSSGAYFATQMHVAYSASIKGAGIIAGGPYNCGGQMSYSSCMNTNSPAITQSISNTKSWSGSKIDDISNMARQKVYMISGTADTTVGASVMTQLYKYYVTDGKFTPSENIVFKKDLNAAHTFPTDFDSTGNNGCGSTSSPYISNCRFDGAGAILEHIYGPLNPRNNGALTGQFIEFNQEEFLSNARANGMSTTAWVYVPKTCADGATCKLHIAYHGCLQGYEKISDKYVKNTGYNRWADTNNFIILYPQAVATNTISSGSGTNIPNPNGCWDWVGWYGSDFSVKSGKQLSAMKKMIDRITEGFSPIEAPREIQVLDATDESLFLGWSAVQSAVGYNLYRNGGKVNSAMIASTTYIDINLNSGTSYTYTVKAISGSGSESAPSKSVTGKTTGEPPAVSAPDGLTASDITSNSISLKWNAVSGVTSYNVYRNGAKVINVFATSYTDISLNSGTEYRYQVSSIKGLSESERSNEIQATTLIEKVCFNDNNYNHVAAGRAYTTLGYVYAKGSNQNMGLYNVFQKTNLCKIKEEHYVIE